MTPDIGLLVLIGAFYGATTGSFLGVIIDRIPAGQPITGRSHCTCGRQLTWRENIPIASWITLRGRSRCCNTPIPAWYLALELAFATVFATAAALPIPVWARATTCATVAAAVATTAVGVRRRRARQ